MKNRMKICGLLLCTLWPPLTANAQTYSKTESITYHDNTAKWVLGQVTRMTCTAPTTALPTGCGAAGTVISETTYDPTYALPLTTKSFGKLQQTLTYDTTSIVASGQLGTIKTIKDGNNNITTLGSWKRGVPQSIKYPITPESPTGATQAAVVNDNGWITSVTDENGYKTCYAYDAMGRMSQVTYPSDTVVGVCDTSKWLPTTQVFEPVAATEYGIPAGHWRQTVSTGNGKKISYYDALWRPLVTKELDATSAATELQTKRFQRFAYDLNGRQSFASYPGITDALTTGTWTEYDALGRPTSVSQDSEQGLLTTTTVYQSGFKTRVTNPRLKQTTTSYMAFDQPTYELPVAITSPAGQTTQIARDVFGKPTSLVRSGGGVSATRSYVYDGAQQLCKTIEPETGATIIGFDAAGNLTWSAAGLAYPSTAACEQTAAYASGRAVLRTYDARNRLSTLVFPDGRGNQAWTYTPDGLPALITTDGSPGTPQVVNAYSYNRRRQLAGEAVTQVDWYTWSAGYGYNANGHQAVSLTYPNSTVINFAPNALGQATQAGTYATGVSYHPNGALKQFTYGNGIVHTMTQNARQLPVRSTEGAAILDLAYGYDANGNVSGIGDYSTLARQTRSMVYDDLDRLTQVTSPMFGTAAYSYDALDNLKTATVSGGSAARNYAYVYDPATWQLTNIQNGVGGPTVIGLGYDVQGNLSNKNGVVHEFDYGNRLRSVTGQASYRYDGQGRRVYADKPSGGYTLSQYSANGQLLFQQDSATGLGTNYIYLAGSLVAFREQPTAGGAATVKYQHTDALGTPIAVTDASGTVIQRSEYEAYGNLLNRPLTDGPGFTGHVQDAATGLTYMQQRYYDPGIGRFLSVDPVTADASTGGNFNRYKYANNNPYAFTDPDGRAESPAWMRAIIPGQVTWDAAVTSAEQGNYGMAAVQGTVAIAEGVMGVLTLGESQALATTSRVAIQEASALTRAKQIQGALNPRTQNSVTTAVAETKEGIRVVGSSEGALRPAARAAMQPGEVAAKGVRGTHAEVNAVQGARAQGLTPTSVSPSRPACTNCQEAMKELGVKIKDKY